MTLPGFSHFKTSKVEFLFYPSSKFYSPLICCWDVGCSRRSDSGARAKKKANKEKQKKDKENGEIGEEGARAMGKEIF